IVMLLIPRQRRRGLTVFATGIAFVLIAMLWPASEQRVAAVHSRLDEIAPHWQFEEHHEIQIDAPPERIYAAIREVTAREIRFFGILTTIRCLGRCRGESILNAPDAKPILDVATRSGFRLLADDPPHELVIGARVAPQTAAIMNFRVERDGRLTTETRVFSKSDKGRRSFAVYWRIIRPGSGIIRRSWLEAIKRRAEAK
ncbi:MAG: hypothetical protein ACRD3J_14885, partial [Thermoanaerobaculia bacterium]